MTDNEQRLISRRDFVKISAGLAAGFGTVSSLTFIESCNTRQPPNIILILADDLGYGDLGCYGQTQLSTPHIDKLALEGMLFTDHYAGSTVCAPSRCSLLTGFHTGHTLVRGNANQGVGIPLRPQDVTIAEILKQKGYTTGIIGKWGLGVEGTTGEPNKQGFDYSIGYLNQRHAHNYYPEYLWKNGGKYYLEGNELRDQSIDGSGVSVRKVHYSHDLFTREALSFIKRNTTAPFFLYLAYTIPHANNEAGLNGMEVPDDAPYANRDWPQALKNYATMISRLDRDVGKIKQCSIDLGIDRNTILIFTSDNGPHNESGFDHEFFNSNGSFRGRKRDLYEGGIRVPMIARWPGNIKAGSVSNHVSAFWDFFPTAAELAGIKSPKGIDGISFLPELLGNSHEQPKHDFLYWEYNHRKSTRQAVRMGDWKAVSLHPQGPLELYNLKTNIGESINVADQNPQVVRTIKEFLQIARVESEYWPLSNIQ